MESFIGHGTDKESVMEYSWFAQEQLESFIGQGKSLMSTCGLLKSSLSSFV
jgi:hypothetical protein